MDHASNRGRWVPLAVAAVLCGLLGLVTSPAVGAQDTQTYQVDISGNCPATPDEGFTYTLIVTNNGTEPIEVSALAQTFTVAPGAAESVEFPDEALGNGLSDSIRVDGERPDVISIATPACAAPLPGYTIDYATACPGQSEAGTVTVTNRSSDPIEITAADTTFTVDGGATISREAPAGLTAADFAINGNPIFDGAFTAGIGRCVDPPSSTDDPPSSSDNPPSSNDDVTPIAVPLAPTYTG